ncbi:hypothetical protein J3R83DRAFT_7863 [Lanmaoa asiatica]|nr:hypothetical protein J3R83DRAFT_7863 [Lanmaoa asiatica]
MTFVSYILPPILGYYAVAVLAVTPRTHTLRVALWPVVALLALRAVASVDPTLGEPDRKFYNTVLVVSLSFHVDAIQTGGSQVPATLSFR